MSAQPAIVQQLTEQHLPVFAHTVRAFRRALMESVLNWNSIGAIILKDPGLVLQALQQLKSGSKRAADLEVTDMSKAVMLLGMERVKKLTDGLPVVEQSLDKEFAIKYTKAVGRAIHAAYHARNWAQWRNDYAPEEVYIATLLHSIPEFALWVGEPEKMHQLRKRVYKNGMSADEAHHITLGQSLQHYGRQVTSELRLPSFLHEVFRPENARSPRVQSVLLAVQLANYVEFGWYSDKVTNILAMVADNINKSLDETTFIVHQNAIKVARESSFTNVRPAASLLALVPTDDDVFISEEFPDEPEIEEANASSESEKSALREVATDSQEIIKHGSGSITIDPPPKKPILKQDVGEIQAEVGSSVCFNPQPALFSKAVKELEAGMGKLNTEEIIRIVVHGMHDGIGLHRVVFASQISKRPYLDARFMTGTDNDPVFSKFQVKLDNHNLFSRLMEKPASVWINDENRNRYWPLVPADFKVFAKVNSFCALSIFVASKPVGLFYADRHSTDCKIDKQAFTLFRKIGQLTVKCLAASPKT